MYFQRKVFVPWHICKCVGGWMRPVGIFNCFLHICQALAMVPRLLQWLSTLTTMLTTACTSSFWIPHMTDGKFPPGMKRIRVFTFSDSVGRISIHLHSFLVCKKALCHSAHDNDMNIVWVIFLSFVFLLSSFSFVLSFTFGLKNYQENISSTWE